MAKQSYSIGDCVELVDEGGCTWWFKIIDETELYYILESHPDDPEGGITSALFTGTNKNAQEGLLAFKKKNFNPEKLSDEDIADILEEYKEYEE